MGSGKYVIEDAVVEDDCILNDVDDAADDPEIPKKTGRPLHDIPVGVHTADLDAFPKSAFAEPCKNPWSFYPSRAKVL